MSNVIKHKRSTTPGLVPSTGSLEQAELAINITDGKLYTKNDANSVINLGVTSISGTYITPSSGNFFNYLAINGVPVSVSGHSHLAVPQAQSLVTTVFNKTANTIPKFSVVYINGGQGDQATIQLAIADGETGSSKTYGITAEAISSMSTGNVIVAGALSGVNTDVFNPTAPVGDVNGITLYLSPTVSGGITSTKPYAPNHLVSVATVVRTHQNAGIVEVKIQNGFELDELHNVFTNGTSNGQFLQYNSSSGLWLSSSSGNFTTLQLNGTGVVAGAGGTVNYISKFNNSNTITNSIIYDNGTNVGIGTINPSSKLQVSGLVTFNSGLITNNLNLGSAPFGTSPLLFIQASDSSAITSSFRIDNTSYQPIMDARNDGNIAIGNISGPGLTHRLSIRGSTNDSTRAALSVSNSGASNLLYVRNDGNIGIGTTTPSGQLHVVGDTYIDNSFKLYIVASGASKTRNYIWSTSNGNLEINAGGPRVLLSPDGGTVDIGGTVSQSINIGHGYLNAGANNQHLRFTPGGTELMRITNSGTMGIGLPTTNNLFNQQPYANTRVHIAGSGATSSSAALIVTNSGISPLLYVRNDGNIGVGTTTPSAQLHVIGTGIFSNRLGIGTHNPGVSLDVRGSVIFNEDGADNDFRVEGDTATNLFFVDASTDNVGINTNAPSTRLQVNGTFSCGSNSDPSVGGHGLLVDPANDTIAFYDSGPNNLITVNANGLTLYDITSNPFFYIDRDNSKVGIGTSSPSTTLHVGGDALFGTNITVEGNLTVNGSVVTANVDRMEIEDPIITLGLASGNIVTTDTLDRGLALVRGTGLTAFMGWDSSATQFVMLSSGVASNSSGNYNAGTYGNLQINNLNASSGNFSSNLTVNNTGVSLNGHNHNGIYADIATGDPQTQSNSIVDNSYALYDPANEWPGLWIFDSSVNASDPAVFDSFKSNMGLLNAVTGTGVANHIAYWNSSSGIVADSGQLYWDATNNRLGVGTSSPSVSLEVGGSIRQTWLGTDLQYAMIYDNSYRMGINYFANQRILNLFSTSNDSGGHLTFSTRLGAGSSSTDYGTERMRITSSGNIGIGTASPSYLLDVNGTIGVSGIARFNNDIYMLDNTKRISWDNGTEYIGRQGDSIIIGTQGANRILVNSTGGVGIGTDSPGATLDVRGSAIFNEAGVDADFRIEGDTDTNLVFVDASTDRVGIGTSTPSDKLNIVGNISAGTLSNTQGKFIAYGSASQPNLLFEGFGTDGTARISTNSGANRQLKIENDGASNTLGVYIEGDVGIGTTTPGYKLQVAGSFGATTKSFRIDHPSKKGYSLEYGSLESPYHGVRLTGRGKVIKGVGTVDLPDYLKDLIHDDESITIQLTNYKHGKTLYVSNIDLQNDKFIVKADRAKSFGELEFFWTLTGVRKDVEDLVVEKEN